MSAGGVCCRTLRSAQTQRGAHHLNPALGGGRGVRVEGAPDRLHGRVVVAIGAAAHRRDQAVLG